MTMEVLAAEPSNAIRALEENFWALWSRFGRSDGCHLHDEPHALWYETPIPTLPYNAVIRFSATRGIDRSMDRIFERFRGRDVPFIWIVHPSTKPPNLESRLRSRGFEEAEVVDGMWVDLAQLPAQAECAAGIEIRQVTSASDIDALLDLVTWRWDVSSDAQGTLRTISRAFEFGSTGSAVRCWIAWKGETPVAKALLNVAAGSAGLYAVATKPDVRGLGLARTLALRAFDAARREGIRLGVLHSTPMARSLYTKLGFCSIAPFRVFAPPRTFHM
jgi:ribosomal protein S18 acetylase RimI-like enzyme